MTENNSNRNKFTLRNFQKTNFEKTIPANKPILPSLKGRNVSTFVPKTLDQLIGKEKAPIYRDYAKILQRFKTTDPTRIQQMFEEIKKKNQQQQRQLNLIQRDCRKLTNRIECVKLMLLKPEEREQKIIEKIDQIVIKCGLNPEDSKLSTKLKQITDFCKYTIYSL